MKKALSITSKIAIYILAILGIVFGIWIYGGSSYTQQTNAIKADIERLKLETEKIKQTQKNLENNLKTANEMCASSKVHKFEDKKSDFSFECR
ncbi:hypothetical protein [Helicobacter pylori]|uniref:hypothetical protein n=1 Tax=Helicobacter pylori TaxID=210 RepID=UPI000EB01AC9|nr:hypothetical protein [Helicobacter pylori]MCQ2916538.1 hypothetical protein [Helicobacter pylori]RKV56001.1 hypothetical protein DD775_02705 [Helicobacter pylori]